MSGRLLDEQASQGVLRLILRAGLGINIGVNRPIRPSQ